jgi:hypothetical protein
LKLNELVLEVMARRSRDDLGRAAVPYNVKSKSTDIHGCTCLRERDFRPHVIGNAERRVQGDRFPDKVRPPRWNPTASENSRAVGAINFESLGFVSLDQTHVGNSAAT